MLRWSIVMTRRFIFLQSMWLSSWKITRPDKQTSRFRTFRPSKHLWRAFEQGKKKKGRSTGCPDKFGTSIRVWTQTVRLLFSVRQVYFHLTFLTLKKYSISPLAWTPCSIREEGKRVLQQQCSSKKKGNFLLNLAVTGALHISSSKATF